MIPNFESSNSSMMSNPYGFQSAVNYHNGPNNVPYNGIGQSQTDEKGDKYVTNAFKDFYQYQNMKDTFSAFTNFQQNGGQSRYGHFGNTDYYPNPYSFFDRVHEMEAKIPLDFARVWLDHQNLWRRFCVCGNEMIITKLGRRMFPVLSFGVHSLNFSDLYTMEVEVIPSDNNRYKYVSVTGWRVNGVASQQEGNKRMYHPEGVQTGEYWQKNGVAFKRIKLTNKKTAKEGSNNIVLNSMHKYHIRLLIKQIGLDDQVIDTKKFEFKETEFIAVTAYQNDDVTQLKIDHNPFAKAFRDNAAEHCGRTSYTSMFAPQPKRRKFDEFDLMPKQSRMSESKIYVPSNSETDATLSLPLTTTSTIHQSGGDAIGKNRQLYNLDSHNYYTNLSTYNFNNQSSMNEWIPHITFDGNDVGAPIVPNLQNAESNKTTDSHSGITGNISSDARDFLRVNNIFGQSKDLTKDEESIDENIVSLVHVDGRI